MKKINGYIILKNQKLNIKNKIIFDEYSRLLILLNSNNIELPKIIFTKNKIVWKKNTGGELIKKCFYNEENFSILLNANFYLIKNIDQIVLKEDIEYIKEKIELNDKYIIPLSDIIHEIIHHIQFVSGNWLQDDILEASAELFTQIILNKKTNDYIKQCTALWYIGRKIMKLSLSDFYIFIRNSIINSNFYSNYFISNPKIIKELAKSHNNGSIIKFFTNMISNYGRVKYYNIMLNDINKIHNLIFNL